MDLFPKVNILRNLIEHHHTQKTLPSGMSTDAHSQNDRQNKTVCQNSLLLSFSLHQFII